MRARLLVTVATMLHCVILTANADLLYSNDFDGNVQTGAGTSVTVSGGTGTGGGIAGGITSSQGFDTFDHFGGDFWRVTAPDDVLEFNLAGVPTGQNVKVDFSLALLDSWDGTSGTFGTDVINVAILDGTTRIAGFSEAYSSGNAPSTGVESVVVQDQQLGFNLGDPFWNEDGYRLSFGNLNISTGNLVLQFWGSSAGTGSGFQGGDDESFAIDNLSISSTPEPGSCSYLLLTFVGMTWRRKRKS